MIQSLIWKSDKKVQSLIELFVAFSNQILLNCPISRCNSSHIYPHLLTTVHSHLLVKYFWDWIFSSHNFSIDKYAATKKCIFSLWVFPSSSYRNNKFSNATQFCCISRHFDSVNVVELYHFVVGEITPKYFCALPHEVDTSPYKRGK